MLKLSHLLEVTDTSEHEYWMHHGLRDKIKKHLMDYEGHSTWKEHVDSCELGGCQYTAHAIARAFPDEVVGVFGEIGTLGDYINWNDKYDDDVGPDDWRYHPIHKRGQGIDL
mgnify:CR=1 FL=1